MSSEKDYFFEIKKEILRGQLDYLKSTISAKFDILSTISVLVAALLVIATFNEALLEINLLVKILIVVLLFLMPLSLFFKFLDINMAEESIYEQLDKVTGLNTKKIIREKRKERGRFWAIVNKIVAYSPFVVFAIFTLIIIVVIYLILI